MQQTVRTILVTSTAVVPSAQGSVRKCNPTADSDGLNREAVHVRMPVSWMDDTLTLATMVRVYDLEQ